MTKDGSLCEAYRVSLFDDFIEEIGTTYKIGTATFSHVGWIVYNPYAGPFGFFVNKKTEKMFENLGEL